MFMKREQIRCHQEPGQSEMAYPANAPQFQRCVEALKVSKGMMKKKSIVDHSFMHLAQSILQVQVPVQSALGVKTNHVQNVN